jgi:hypothetical protein
MIFQEDLSSAKKLIKDDNDSQLKRDDGSFASWAQPGQNITYYLWNDEDASVGAALLEKFYVDNSIKIVGRI